VAAMVTAAVAATTRRICMGNPLLVGGEIICLFSNLAISEPLCLLWVSRPTGLSRTMIRYYAVWSGI